jgi:hypothetical protein
MTGRATASRLRKTHNIAFEPKQLFYPWHRWHGREVLTRKATGSCSEHSLWCRLPEDAPDAMLVSTPCWMFDAAVCARIRMGDKPSVDCAALRAVRDLIDEVRASIPSVVLQDQRSQPENLGDADANDKLRSISNQSAGVVLRANSSAAVETPSRAPARRSDQESGAASVQRSRRRAKPRSSQSGSVR